jgi:Formylmethanofuran dehydrogenase subunit B
MQFFKKVALRFLIAIALLVACEFLFNFLLCPYTYYGRSVNHDLQQVQGTIDTVFVGSSWTYYGYNVDEYEKRMGSTAFNIGTIGQSVEDSYYYLKEITDKNPVKTVYFNVTDTKFTSEPSIDQTMVVNDRLTGLNKLMDLGATVSVDDLPYLLPSFLYKDSFNPKTILNNIKYKMSEDYKNYVPINSFYVKNGYISTNISIKQGNNSEFKATSWDESKVLSKDVDYFNKIISMCKEKQIQIIILTPPFSSAYLQNISNYDGYLNFIRSLCKQNDVDFIDFNLLKDPVFLNDELFHDIAHLNGSGNVKLTDILCDIMQEKHSGKSSDYRFYTSYAEKEQVFNYCTGVKLNISKSQNSDNAIELLAKAANTNNLPLEYRFSIYDPKSGHLNVIRDYNQANTMEYDFSYPGTLKFRVECRAIGSGQNYEAYNENTYTFNTIAEVRLNKEKQGKSAILTASVSDLPSDQLEYQFVETNDGINFQVLQDFGPKNTFLVQKDTALFYRVNVRQIGSSLQYLGYAYDIGPVASATDYSNFDLTGTIDWQDAAKLHLDATSYDTPHLYRFSMWTPGDIYVPITGFGLNDKLDVVLDRPGMYRYLVECKAIGSEDSQAVKKDFFIDLQMPLSSIGLSASAKKGGVSLNVYNPNETILEYQFGYYDKNNNFNVIQDYSTDNKAWCPDSLIKSIPGDVRFQVNCKTIRSSYIEGFASALYKK